MERKPLMPKATAVWLVENTSLSFDQIADFCGLHKLEIKGIADGDVAAGIRGMDPITGGQLTREEIKKAEGNPDYRLRLATSKVKIDIPVSKPSKKGNRYTPLSRRHARPNAVLWLIKNHPEMKDSQIMRLVGTTKPTIAAIRGRTHWDSANLQAQDPVALGLCTQIDLDAEVQKAARRVERDDGISRGGTLLPTAETTAIEPEAPPPAPEDEPTQPSADEDARVLARLRELGSSKPTEDAEDNAD